MDEAQNYPNCTTPWHESMLSNKKYFQQNSSSDTCDETEKQKQVQMDTRFIKYSLTNKKAQCKGINRLMMFLNSIKTKINFLLLQLQQFSICFRAMRLYKIWGYNSVVWQTQFFFHKWYSKCRCHWTCSWQRWKRNIVLLFDDLYSDSYWRCRDQF